LPNSPLPLLGYEHPIPYKEKGREEEYSLEKCIDMVDAMEDLTD
jgi:hypothetical protein